jgi:putative methyltransferase (TIGR04325 family)
MLFKKIIKAIIPPIFIDTASLFRLAPSKLIEWEYIPEGWSYSSKHPEVKGWNVESVLEIYKDKWPRFVKMVEGAAPLGVAHESSLINNEDILSHNTTISFGYALALAAKNKDHISILDWGGGIGHYYLLAKALLPDVDIDYNCKDVQLLCEYGAQLFPNQHFYIDERCFERKYDFVLASTSMHYTEDWKTLFKNLANSTDGYLYIANLPIVQQVPSFVFVQRPYQYGYNTEYISWCLNQTEFLQTAEEAGFKLLRKFVYGHKPIIHGAPEQNIYYGFLFKRVKKRNKK